jgi:outer membrane protein assembly factor BamD (BamD/ComL family)
LADIVRAKQTLRDLIQNYPNAEIIPSAKSRLDALNAIKL